MRRERFLNTPLHTGVWLLTVCLLFAACDRHKITVSSASSLTDGMREVAAEFERTGSAKVALNLAGSGVLEAQIRAGAPVDVFASASSREPESLFSDSLVEPPVEFARNRLVLATRAGLPALASFTDLSREDIQSIAIGSPATVPSGRYAEQCIRNGGLWDEIQERLVPCENVRQVLAYVERGEVDAAFLYSTDMRHSRRSLAALAIPDSLHEPIRYLVCIVRDPQPQQAAHAFVRYLISEEGQAVLQRHGFLPQGTMGS